MTDEFVSAFPAESGPAHAPGWANGRDRQQLSSKRFELVAFDDIKIGKAPGYLVRGVLPRIGLVVMWGPPKCGKSFIAFDLLMHVALGWKFRGRRLMGGPVVYCALEGAEGFKRRIEAFRQAHLQQHFEPVPFYLASTPLNLIADHFALAASIEATLRGVRPAAIVIDTVNRSLAGSESDDRDMAAYIAAADVLKNRFGCLVLVIHHSGVDASRPRGHTSLAGAVDAQISVKKDPAGLITATVELTKDFQDGAQIVSRLASVEIGTDDEGESITSCIVEAVDYGDESQPKPKRKLSDRQQLALDALITCVLDRGEAVPASFDLPGAVKAVAVAAWRDELFARGVLDREATNPRSDFKKLKERLCATRVTSEREGLIWPL